MKIKHIKYNPRHCGTERVSTKFMQNLVDIGRKAVHSKENQVISRIYLVFCGRDYRSIQILQKSDLVFI